MNIGPVRVEPLPGRRIRMTRADGTGPALEMPAACLACITRTRACPNTSWWRRTLSRLIGPRNGRALGRRYRAWRQSRTEGLHSRTYIDACHWR